MKHSIGLQLLTTSCEMLLHFLKLLICSKGKLGLGYEMGNASLCKTFTCQV